MANKEAQQCLNKITSSPSNSTVVVMVPFPAQSHLNQLLQLSHVISSHNIKVHYVASDLHLAQVKSRATDQNPNPNIQYHGFQTPEFPSPPPNNPRFPSHLIPCFESYLQLRTPVKTLLESLSDTSTRLVLIHDPLMSYVVQDHASLPNSEAYVFHCVSAISHFNSLYRNHLKIKEEIPWFEGAMDPWFQSFIDFQIEIILKNRKAGILHNTCRLLEGQFLDLIWEKNREVDENFKQWAIGPFESVTKFRTKKRSPRANGGTYNCLEWLDEQDPGSVLYVSFGTMTHMRDDQIKELAIGLEKSRAKFIWVLRDADRGDVFDDNKYEVRRPELPLGFEERVEGMGIGVVVREWAPQLEILGHSSTGGFMSHCGWNSVLESLSLGVPLVAWPMHSDQPTNAFLVTEILKAGLALSEWAKRDESVSSSVISDVVKRLMSSDEGNEIRQKAQELGCELRKCTEKGGVSRLELDSFIAHITRA